MFQGQHGCWPGFSCESQFVLTVCKGISDSLDNGVRTDAIIIYFSKASDSVPHDGLLKKTVASGVGPRVLVWIREFLLGLTQRVRVGGQLLEGE
jgi:hypothetical protein